MALTALGAVCYAAGVLLILRRYRADPRWGLARDWDSTNCILHGALSITGLTAVVGGLFSVAPIARFWIVTAAVFCLVEAIETARLVARVRLFGWREAVLVYDTSQWARNFTIGMFYAFTAAFAGRFDIAGWGSSLAIVVAAILAWGQYAVLLLLLVELALMALAPRSGSARTAASSRRAG